MGRRRRKHHNGLSLFTHARFVDDVIDQEKARSEQKEYAEKARAIEEDLLTRTIFVTNVLDLNDDRNVQALRRFMEQNYGTVVRCVKDKYNTRRPNHSQAQFPPARVTFAAKHAAEKVFNGMALRSATPQNIFCPAVGHRGTIRVTPSRRYTGMLTAALTGNCLSFQSDCITFGHWIPSFDDAYLNWENASNENEAASEKPSNDQEPETFYKEADQSGPLEVSIDLSARKIEISSIDCALPSPTNLNMLLMNILAPAVHRKDILSVRFKELRNHFRLCEDVAHGGFCLVFATKWPPKLETKDDQDVRQRETTFCSVPCKVLGRCLGFMISIPKASLPLILNHESNERLRKFGVFPNNFSSREALPLQIDDSIKRQLDIYEGDLASSLGNLSLRRRRIGKLGRGRRPFLMLSCSFSREVRP